MIRELLQLVEAIGKPGVMSLKGIRRENRCTRDLAKYFTALAEKIAAAGVGEVATIAPSDAALHAADMKLQRVLRGLRPLLIEVLSVNLYEAILEGDKVASVDVQEASQTTPDQLAADAAAAAQAAALDFERRLKRARRARKAAVSISPLDKLGLSGKEAAEYAAEHAAKLVKGIDETTRKMLREAIAIGIEQRLGVDGLARLIRKTVMDMATYRARLIASTEMNDAFSEAALRKMKRLGLQFKRIVLAPGACKICQDNEAKGPIPVEDDFPSGEPRTPFHPWCRCAIVPSRPPAEA